MLHLVYQNNEALRCADLQDLANKLEKKTAHLTHDLNKDLDKTWGRCAPKLIRDIHRVQDARHRAIASLRKLCEQQAALCRAADTAYQNTDDQAAEHIAQELRFT